MKENREAAEEFRSRILVKNMVLVTFHLFICFELIIARSL